MNQIIIRKAEKGDVVEIVRLLADDFLGYKRECYIVPLPEKYYDAFGEIDLDNNNELIVAEKGSTIIGTLQLTFIPSLTFQGSKRAQIEAVRVDKKYRGQSIGRQLFDWAIARAREKDCHVIQLTTNKERPEALQFYLRMGFTASHEGMKLDLTI